MSGRQAGAAGASSVFAIRLLAHALGLAAAAPPQPVNLVATPVVKAALLAAFVKANPQYVQRGIVGPEKGRTYYGRYGSVEYAVASFDFRRGHLDDQPEVFRRPVGGRWLDTGDTGGEVCPPRIPLALLKTWRWVVSSYGVSHGKKYYCYREPL